MPLNPLIAATQSEDQGIERLMDQLDSMEKEMGQARKHPRVPYRKRNVRVWIDQPGGSISTLSVWTRNISCGGLSVVLRTFVHPGSHCRADLPQIDGGMLSVYGEVRWCRFLTGSLHEFGMQFQEPLDLHLLLTAATLPGALRGDSASEARPTGEALAAARSTLADELMRIIERPNLAAAKDVCRRLQELAATTTIAGSGKGEAGAVELHYAATLALQSLAATGSVAQAEQSLRQLCSIARSLGQPPATS